MDVGLAHFLQTRLHLGFKRVFREELGRPPLALRWAVDGPFVLVHPTADSDLTEPFVKEANGVIFARRDFQVVCRDHPVAERLPWSWFLSNRMWLHGTGATAEYTVDGTVIRVFFWRGIWRTSTHRKSDARKSRFGGANFHALFMDCGGHDVIGRLVQHGDRRRTYIFVLTHPDQVNVIANTAKRLTFVGSVNNITGDESDNNSLVFSEAAKHVAVELDTVEPAEKSSGTRGIMVRLADGRRIVVDFPWFSEAVDLLGDHRDVKEAFVAKFPTTDVQPFFHHFPERAEWFHDWIRTYHFLVEWVATMAELIRVGIRVPEDHPAHGLVAATTPGQTHDETLKSAYSAVQEADLENVKRAIRKLGSFF